MKQIASIIVFFVFFGCATKIAEEDIQNLNGYWEIEKVTFANGQTKDFTVNPSVDYMELEGLKGFRKKMQPKFDGSYTTSNDAELFTIVAKDEKFEFHYKNKMSAWSEKITILSENTFSVVNQDTITYTYKRFQPINVTD